MLDELFFKRGYEKHKIDYILFGFIISIIGIVTSMLIFGINSSESQLLIITLLLIPTMIKIFSREEKIIRKPGLNYIHENHRNVFEVFTFLFVGVLLAFLLTQLIVLAQGYNLKDAYSFQTNILDENDFLSYGFLDKSELGSFSSVSFSLVSKLVIVITASFVLSFLYGAGGIFVMVAMASILSTSIIYLIKATEFMKFSLVYLIFFLLLLFPIILASIAGGVISKAFVHEKLRSKYFREVIKEGFFIFLESLVIAIIIALIWAAFLFV